MSEYLPKPVWLLWRERAEAAEARIAELEAELNRRREDIDKYEYLMATAYQLAGLVGAPTRFLDAYALVCKDVDPDTLLPVTLDELDEFARLQAELSKVRAERDKSRDDLHATMAKVLDGYRELALRLSAAEAELAKARAAIQSMSAVLSQIDYLCGEPNDMHVSGYDVHCDEEAVLRHVKHRLAELDEFVRLRQGGNQDD